MEHFTPKHLQFKISEAKRIEGKFCCACRCKSKPNDKKKGMCHKHYAIHRRILDPVYDRYVNFRGNALRRGKGFFITLEEFRDWCNEKGYIVKKGMRGRNCTIDRVKNWLPYTIDNIQIKTALANTAKYYNEDRFAELPDTHEDYTPF